MTAASRSGVLESEMRRFLAAVLSSSLPLLAVVPAQADAPSREVEYAVVATSGGVARRATVTVDFIGGSAERVMRVNVRRTRRRQFRTARDVGITPDGSLRATDVAQLTAEEETICSLMSLESEDLAGVSTGDHWEREGPVPGGRHHTHYAVLGVDDAGDVQFSVARDLEHSDGSSARWRGTMDYDANGFVPERITLKGDLTAADDDAAGRTVAMTISLIHDTFKH